jgi:hypothetical protein
MRHREPTLDPEAVRQLEALDAALAGEPVDPDLEDLAVLARELRDTAPKPDADFAAALDARAAAGFPRGAGRTSADESRGQTGDDADAQPAGPLAGVRRAFGALIPPRRFPLAAAGAAASILLVVVVAAVALQSGGGDDTTVERSQPESAEQVPAAPSDSERSGAPGAAPSEGESSDPLSAAPVAPDTVPGGGDDAPNVRRRRVERAATLTIAIPADKLNESTNRVQQIASASRSIVVDSDISSDEDSGRATFALRVPVSRLQPTLADLAEIGTVTQRNETGHDVTGAYVSADERLDDLIAARASVRRQLAATDDADRAARLRRELRQLQGEISSARAALDSLRQRTSYANVDVTLATEKEKSGGATGAGTWTPGDALDDAGKILGTSLGVLIIVLAILVPLALVATAIALPARSVVRRRRERVLDDAP